MVAQEIEQEGMLWAMPLKLVYLELPLIELARMLPMLLLLLWVNLQSMIGVNKEYKARMARFIPQLAER